MPGVQGDARDYNMDEMAAEFVTDNANFKPAKFRLEFGNKDYFCYLASRNG